MDSFERMNEVISYIEENIMNDIDFSHIAKIACCPMHQFQRLFSFLMDITLSDYIRRRRLSLAAVEIQQSNVLIIDVAIKYGYDSHASFTRAFREQHKMSPSSARGQGVILNIYPKISFQALIQTNPNLNYRITKGKIKMAKLIKIEFARFGPYKIIGKQLVANGMSNSIPVLWAECFSDGTYDMLLQMKEYVPSDIADDYIGYVRDCKPDGSYTYVVGMFMKADAPVPDGFVSYDIPACTIAKAWIQGEEYEIYSNADPLTVEAVKQNGYDVDWGNYFKCEVYTDLRFGIPKNNGEKVLVLDVYIPCLKC